MCPDLFLSRNAQFSDGDDESGHFAALRSLASADLLSVCDYQSEIDTTWLRGRRAFGNYVTHSNDLWRRVIRVSQQVQFWFS